MALEFKSLSMTELRNAPGDIVDKVQKEGLAFIIERSGQQKACLVPVSFFFPDIPNAKINEEIEELRRANEKVTQSFTEERERAISFKHDLNNMEVTLKIVLPHGYPNAAPKIYAFPLPQNTPHRWQDGSLCIFGAMENWNPGKHTLSTILGLAREWLSHYETWEADGAWPDKKELKS